jgi:adenylyltransferase/sulfurtransferase
MTDAGDIRYSRHIGLPAIGAQGQQKLEAAIVLVVGLGGLGSAASLYLANSGIGRLLINDFDRVDATNLPRQILFDPEDLGRHKAEAAAAQLKRWNPDIQIIPLPEHLERRALKKTVADCTVVLDCTDNFASRWLINEVCAATHKPLVSGAAIRFEGQLAVFRHEPGKGPCYRCLYAEADENLEDCAGQGILAPVAGTVGCMMATEAIKVVVGLTSEFDGRLWVYDAMAGTSRSVKIPRREDCPVCGPPT